MTTCLLPEFLGSWARPALHRELPRDSLKYIPAQILVLDDVGQAVADVGGVYGDLSLAGVGGGEGDILGVSGFPFRPAPLKSRNTYPPIAGP